MEWNELMWFLMVVCVLVVLWVDSWLNSVWCLCWMLVRWCGLDSVMN